jgi:histone acetyltransferase 1
MPKNQPTADLIAEPKKRRRVGFSNADAGVEANECIKIYIVSSKEEVNSSDAFCIEPVDLNDFFDDADGKIYGYKELKITIWISSISFHSYADITFASKSDGGKGITDLKANLQKILADTLVEDKDEFLQTFSRESGFIGAIVSNGEILNQKVSNGHTSDPDVEFVRLVIGNPATGHLYSRVIPLVLLLIDGSSPIDVEDPQWELYLLIQKQMDQQGDAQRRLLGFTSVYRFYHYPDCTRLRLSQILVLPPYQQRGYGAHLVEALNNVAIADNVYDFTVEEPLDDFQRVRTFVDIKKLLAFDPIKDAIQSVVSSLKQGKLSKKVRIPRFVPPTNAIEDVRKNLKINKIQFLQCWEILIYLGLGPESRGMEDYTTIVGNRVKADILGEDSEKAGKKTSD